MTAKPLLYSGADAVRAAEKIRQTHANQEQWPYVHCFPPVNSIPVNQTGSVVTPALSAQAVILTYKVPPGFKFIMTGVVAMYINSGTLGAFLPGQGLFTLDLNTPPGVTNIQASPVQGLTALTVPLGNYLAGVKWYLERAYEFAPLDELRWKGTNVGLPVGTPAFFAAGVFGWLLPAIKEPK